MNERRRCPLLQSAGLSFIEYVVHKPVIFGFFRGEIVVSVRIAFDFLDAPARVLGEDAVHFILDFEDMFRLNFDVARLTLRTAEGLMDHDLAVGQSKALALCAAGQEEGAHACRHADADGGDVAMDVLHGVVDRHARRHAAAGAVDVQADVLVHVLGFEVDELGNDGVCHAVADLTRKEDDPVLEQSRIDVIRAFPAAGLLHDHGDQVISDLVHFHSVL